MHRHIQKRRYIVKAKSNAQRNALHRLNSFLNTNNPKLIRILVTTWKDQEEAITYKELREAILRGYMSEEQFMAWQQDYVAFFNKHLKDMLSNAVTTGAKGVTTSLIGGVDIYTPMSTGIDNWVTVHGAEWITLMSDEAKEAVSSMISYSAKGNMSVDELARVIRPTIGLTKPQSIANAKYYETVKAQLLNDNPNMRETTAVKRAREAAARYAGRQHRYRAQMIADTELAFAYNKGADDAIYHAVNDGLLPKMKSVWSTAADDGVCDICAALDGVEIEHGDNFDFKGRSLYSGQKQTPPAHPGCRCALCYEEAE